MKKTLFMLPALALMLFAACSSEDAVTKDNTVQQNETTENAVGFSAYMSRSVTRAGWAGGLTTSTGTNNLQTEGFGVFAYYADGDLYTENATPNFMYNQDVKYTAGRWSYSPIKYWPNEFGSSAVSTGVDRVTFFAYAPYVAVEPTTGQLTSYYNNTTVEKSTETGITSLTRNGKTGDPYVRYVGAFNPDNCVDLCYGVAAADYNSSVGAADGANNVKKGEPYLNIAKPMVGSDIYFDFKHALAQLTVKVDADVDIVGHGVSDDLDDKTRIWVRSITFDGIAPRGYLNLNSGMWYEVMDNNKISHASVTVYDGRRDGSEALADDSYEYPTGFHDDLVQKAAYTAEVAPGTTFPYTTFTSTTPGVKGDYKNLFAGSGNLLVIPANEQLKVTIVYDVETADATLPTYLSDGVTKGSTVENKITKNITLDSKALKLDAGKAYTLNLHLGMTSVTFNATVSDWVEGGEADVDLPFNAANGNAVAGSTSNVVLDATETAGTFTITNLTDGNTMAATPTGDVNSATATAPTGGASIVNYTILAANNTVNNKTGVITVTEKDASTNLISVTTINVTQKAAALGLKVTDVSGSDIVLGCTDGLTSPWTSVVADGDHVKVSKTSGGTTTALEYGTGSGKFTYDDDNNKIILGTAPAAGDIYTITIQAGDAEAETVTARIGAISFATTSDITVGKNRTFTQTVNNTGTGAVSYAGSSSKVTVNPSTGLVTGVTVSESLNDVTITATVTDDATNGWFYLTTEATYTLTVKEVGTVSFAEAVVNELASKASITKAATITTGGGTATYSSSNESVATVAAGGVVTIVGAGTTTITVTVNDGDLVTYPVNTASYTLNVTKANARIYFSAASYTEDSAHESAFKTVLYDPTGADTGAVVTWTSSDTSKATIDTSNNKVVQVGPACTVTITAKVTDTAKYHFIVDTASYELTFSTDK